MEEQHPASVGDGRPVDGDPGGASPPPVDDPAAASSPPADGPAVSLGHAIAVYTALRLGLMAVITVGLMWVMPLIVALAFAVVAQLPLAVLLFPRQRRDLTAALARAKSGRTAERDRLRAALTGELTDESPAGPPAGPPDGPPGGTPAGPPSGTSDGTPGRG